MSAPEQSVPGGGQFGHLALAAVNGTMSDRLKKVLTTYALAGMTIQLAKKWAEKARATREHTVTVFAADDIYGDVHAWLLSMIPPHRRKSLTVRSQRRRDQPEALADSNGDEPDPLLSMLYDGGRQKVSVDGHQVAVHVDKPAFDVAWLKDDNWSRMSDREQLVFTTSSIAGRDAVLELLTAIAAEHYHHDRPPNVYMGTKWGEWRRRKDLPRRSLDTVVLRAGQKEALVDDLTEFFDHEAAYARLGVPWHRGYLFEGPPGSGKTSLAKALASHFNVDIYYVPLSDIESDNYLMQLVTGVEPRSMLLLEDIDVVHAAKARDDDRPGITMSGLLNALDGIGTPHGLITVMTTNDASELEAALTRPGRVDMTEHIGDVDQDQLDRLVATFLGEWPAGPVSIGTDALSPAAVIEVFKRHLDDPAAAVIELKALAI